MSEPRRAPAIIAVILLMIVWGSTFVVTKVAALEIPPMSLAALRFLIATLVLLPVVMVRGGFRRLPRPVPWMSLSILAFTGVPLFTISFNYALLYASATQGALIYGLVPAAVAIAAVAFLGEKLSALRIVGIVASMCGVGIVIAAGESSGEASRPVLGAICMLVTVLAFAWYTVVAKRLAAVDQIVVIACISAMGTAMLLPLVAFELWNAPWPQPTVQGWAGVLFLGVVASALAFIVFGYVLRVLDASMVGVYTNLDPIVGVATAIVFLGEPLRAGQVAGGLIVFVGVWLSSSREKLEVTADPTHHT